VSNKFLELYPELYLPKVGDRVRITKLTAPSGHAIGDTGIVARIWEYPNHVCLYSIKFDIVKVEDGCYYRNEIEIIHG
jgi:hypothetical protein